MPSSYSPWLFLKHKYWLQFLYVYLRETTRRFFLQLYCKISPSDYLLTNVTLFMPYTHKYYTPFHWNINNIIVFLKCRGYVVANDNCCLHEIVFVHLEYIYFYTVTVLIKYISICCWWYKVTKMYRDVFIRNSSQIRNIFCEVYIIIRTWHLMLYQYFIVLKVHYSHNLNIRWWSQVHIRLLL